MRRAGKAIAVLIALFAFVISAWYLARRFEWRDALLYLSKTDFVALFLVVAVFQFAYVLFRAWRWRSAIYHLNPDVSFSDFYWITAVVVSLSVLTPGQLGEALKIELLKRRGLIGRLHGLGALATERILDVVVISGFGVAGMMFGTNLGKRYPAVEIGAIVLLVAGLLGLYLLLRINPRGSAFSWLARIRACGGSPRTLANMAVLTLCSWGCVAVGWKLALSLVHIHLSFVETLWLMSMVTLGALLSFIPGGLGVSEVITTELLSNMGVTPVAAQAGALILRVYGLFVVVFGCGHLVLWPLLNRLSRPPVPIAPRVGAD